MTDLVQSFAGQCRIQVDSTTQISLQRYQGRYINLIVSSALIARLIPSSGPTITNSGLSASTLYYVYAFDNSGTLTLELSTTGHVTDSTFGIETKSGDATRALVGMVFTDGSTHFLDSTSNRYCANWFNRSDHDLVGTFSADRTTTSTTLVELNTEIRVNFLTWADEAVHMAIEGSAEISAGGNVMATSIGIDGTEQQAVTQTGGTNQFAIAHCSVMQRIAEGQHFATLLAAVSSGTGTWASADSISTGPTKTRLWGKVRI